MVFLGASTAGGKTLIRIGQGIDVHPLAPGRPLVLGGVTVPFDRGLEGDTDGDVLTHAIMDALLGAMALGDLGRWFRKGDPGIQGASSIALLGQVMTLVDQKGYQVGNLDCTVVAQRPRLRPYVSHMVSRLVPVLNASPEAVSIKATTTDRLGAIGREEGMMALAVVILVGKNAQNAKPGEECPGRP